MDELGKHIDIHGSIDVVSDFRQLTQAYTLTHNSHPIWNRKRKWSVTINVSERESDIVCVFGM